MCKKVKEERRKHNLQPLTTSPKNKGLKIAKAQKMCYNICVKIR